MPKNKGSKVTSTKKKKKTRGRSASSASSILPRGGAGHRGEVDERAPGAGAECGAVLSTRGRPAAFAPAQPARGVADAATLRPEAARSTRGRRGPGRRRGVAEADDGRGRAARIGFGASEGTGELGPRGVAESLVGLGLG